jgi:site-specific DNA-cytosine methylase
VKILSLFDGISCGRVALQRAGIPVTQYIASEIDKYAINLSRANHPDIIQGGNVCVIRKMAEAGFFGHIDLVIAGSPCQGFSFAGKQLAFNDPRSSLFFEFVAILTALRRNNPNIKFLLENVKMKKEHLDVITTFLGVQPILINSALVSAQSRQRYYWCNWPVTQPADCQILLKNIIEHGFVDRDKSYCIDANYFKGGNLEQYFNKSRRQLVFNYSSSGRGNGVVENRHYEADKALTLTSQGYSRRGFTGVIENAQIRKLTPIECERLQTLPDGYTAHVSNSQRYKMLGNGWTVDVIAHILRSMPR